MAINPSTNSTMAGRITAASAAYPYGSSKNETTPGAGDGTPYFKARADDVFGFQQALLSFAGITPNGNADQVGASQYLDALIYLAQHKSFQSGTVMLFQQTAAPIGWTKLTTHNDKALRVVSGAAGSGGSVAFSTAMASKSVAGTVTIAGHALTVAEMPAHDHSLRVVAPTSVLGSGDVALAAPSGGTDGGFRIEDTGGNNAHSHPGSSFAGTNIDLTIQYVDVILASKD